MLLPGEENLHIYRSRSNNMNSWIAWSQQEFLILVAHKIARGLGPKKALHGHSQSFMHSPFVTQYCQDNREGVGKTQWHIAEMFCAPSDLPEDVLNTIEMFIILLNDGINTCTDICRRGPMKNIFKEDPSEADQTNQGSSCEERNLPERVCMRETYVWGRHCWQLLHCLHWQAGAGPNQKMVWTKGTTLPKAFKACYELYRASTRGYVTNYKCMKAALENTALCARRGVVTLNETITVTSVTVTSDGKSTILTSFNQLIVDMKIHSIIYFEFSSCITKYVDHVTIIISFLFSHLFMKSHICMYCTG